MIHLPSFTGALAVGRSRGRLSENPGAWNELRNAWTMLQGGGSILYDASGYGNNGTPTNGPTWVVLPDGPAMEFDSVSSQYISVPSRTLTEPWTMNWRAAPDNTAFVDRPALGRSDSGNNYLVTRAGSRVRFANDSAATVDWTNDTTFGYQRTFALVAAAGDVTLHLDGISQGARTIDTTFTLNAIGARNAVYFLGTFSNLCVWTRALSASEIQERHGKPLDMFTLVRRTPRGVAGGAPPPGGGRSRILGGGIIAA